MSKTHFCTRSNSIGGALGLFELVQILPSTVEPSKVRVPSCCVLAKCIKAYSHLILRTLRSSKGGAFGLLRLVHILARRWSLHSLELYVDVNLTVRATSS